MEAYLRDWFLTLTTGLGVTFAWNAWFGGLFLAVAGASIAFHHDPERDNRERWVVYVTALVTAHVASIASFWFWPDLPPQLVMFFAGFTSRKIIRLTLGVAASIERRGDGIAKRVIDRVLPGQDDLERRGPPPSDEG